MTEFDALEDGLARGLGVDGADDRAGLAVRGRGEVFAFFLLV
ncbi:hypothetical protein [Nonomuraea dietziae]